MILKPYSAFLTRVFPADSSYLPLSAGDESRLLTLIPEGEEMILTLSDGVHTEWILVTNTLGALLAQRGLDSTARRFPTGACLSFETSLPVIKWMICNHDCCEDAICPCKPVQVAGMVLPTGEVNHSWSGTFIFDGDLPMQLGVIGAPSWANVYLGPNFVHLDGTPETEGNFVITAAATNCAGKYMV